MIGIDLGTTNTRMAVVINGHVKIIENDACESPSTPTTVAFKDHKIFVGKAANLMDSTNTFSGLKHIIGRQWKDTTVEADKIYWPFRVTEGLHSFSC